MTIIKMLSVFKEPEALCSFLLDPENKMRPRVSLLNSGAGEMQIKSLSFTPTSFCGREDTPFLELRTFFIVSVKFEYHFIPLR